MQAERSIRADFPALYQTMNGQPLVYLDNAATTQKPQMVLDSMQHYYLHDNANVHRAAHALAVRATEAMERGRSRLAQLINADSSDEIIFTRGTTESINLVASGFGKQLKPGDRILVTELEHHSNFVPWQQCAWSSGATLDIVKATADGEIDQEDFIARLKDETRLVAFGHVSNALGTVHPVGELVKLVRARTDACILVDGAQAILHLDVDVQALDVDYYAFSAHKMYGPTGMGVLYGRRAALDALPPWQFGGEMIELVTLDSVTFNSLPWRFEAGTPNIAGAVGFGAAVDYLMSIPRAALLASEHHLVRETLSALRSMNGVRLIGNPRDRLGVISFLVEGASAHDVGTLLDQQGIAVRTGHHCTMPLMQSLGIAGTVRASFSLYNDMSDVERFVQAMHKTLTFL
jgi:cysteine desulfurase / selenocysteine lyase